MSSSNAMGEAQKLISYVESLGPHCSLCYEDVSGIITALGGNPQIAKDVQHGPTLFIYIAALMVRGLDNS